MPSFVCLPGYIFQTITVLEANNKGVKTGPMVMLLFWVGVVEIISIPALRLLNTSDRDAGDYALDPLNLSKAGGSVINKYKTATLKNSCLAMMAFGGMITQAALTGQGTRTSLFCSEQRRPFLAIGWLGLYADKWR